MERRRHRQQHGALGALGLGDLERALDRGLVAGDHDLAAAIVVGGLADLALGRFLGDRDRRLVIEPEQCRHGADADRHRLLHGETAGAQQPRGIADGKAAGGGQRGIFPERVPGDIGGIAATEKPASVSSTRSVASDTAISAGCAFSVSCRVSAGPSQMMAVSFSPSAASTSSKTARAAGNASESALPMPTAWEPCPGKVNAAVIDAPECPNVAKVAPKDTGRPQYVKLRCGADGSGFPSPRQNAGFPPRFPCHRGQNPYKPRHPWIPAGS